MLAVTGTVTVGPAVVVTRKANAMRPIRIDTLIASTLSGRSQPSARRLDRMPPLSFWDTSRPPPAAGSACEMLALGLTGDEPRPHPHAAGPDRRVARALR